MASITRDQRPRGAQSFECTVTVISVTAILPVYFGGWRGTEPSQ